MRDISLVTIFRQKLDGGKVWSAEHKKVKNCGKYEPALIWSLIISLFLFGYRVFFFLSVFWCLKKQLIAAVSVRSSPL